MIQRTVPAGTVIETESQRVDQNLLAQLAFPPNAFTPTHSQSPIDNSMIPSEVAELARNWTSGLDRGWRQVQRVVDRLRTDYRLNIPLQYPTRVAIRLPPFSSKPVVGLTTISPRHPSSCFARSVTAHAWSAVFMRRQNATMFGPATPRSQRKMCIFGRRFWSPRNAG